MLNIPEPLKQLNQFVVFKTEERDGKKIKVPYQINGERAKSNDPSTWTSYEEAVDFCNQNKEFYLGFRPVANNDEINNLIIIDLDHVIDEDGNISKEVSKWINRFDSYTEISLSGHGLHILITGELPFENRKFHKNDIDGQLWNNQQFVILTGNLLPGFENNKIKNRNNILQEFLDEFCPNRQELTVENNNFIINEPSEEQHDKDVEKYINYINTQRGKGNLLPHYLLNRDLSAIEKIVEEKEINFDLSESGIDFHTCFTIGKVLATDDPGRIASVFEATSARDRWFHDPKHQSDPDYYKRVTLQKVTEALRQAGFVTRTPPVDSGDDSEKLNAAEFNFDEFLKLNYFEISKKFAEDCKDRIRYVIDSDDRTPSWLVWNGEVWKPSQGNNGEHVDLYSQWAKKLLNLIPSCPAKLENRFRNRVHKIGEGTTGRKILNDAFLNKQIQISSSAIDACDHLICVKNGIVDLRAGELMDFDPNYLLTKQIPHNYNPSATCPQWEQFLREIFYNPKYPGETDEIVRFVQKALGYSLSGNLDEQCVFFLYGPQGANGKSTFMRTISKVLGKEVTGIKANENFNIRDSDGWKKLLANKTDKRIVMFPETGNYHLDLTLLKSVSGDEEIETRQLYHNVATVRNQMHLWFAGNYLPNINEAGKAAWRRIKILEMLNSFANNPDHQLKHKLLAEAEGILTWIIEGARLYYEEGLVPPAAITNSTKEYQSESSTTAIFLNDRYEININATKYDKDYLIKFGDLYASYCSWCATNNCKTESKTKFAQELDRMGITLYRGTDGIRFRVGLKPIPHELRSINDFN